MAISCNPVDLVEEAKCFQCMEGSTAEAVSAELLCQWAKEDEEEENNQ